MLKFYLIPLMWVDLGAGRIPKYLKYKTHNPDGLVFAWGLMDYGFIDVGLLAGEVDQTIHDTLSGYADVYSFPDDLDSAITDPTIDAFLEGIDIPADWLTPSTTYRQLMRSMAGMFQFNQRYGGISGGETLLGGNTGITLDSNWNNLTAQQQGWFYDTLNSFGYSYTVPGNPKLRQLVKQAGDVFASQTFQIGRWSF